MLPVANPTAVAAASPTHNIFVFISFSPRVLGSERHAVLADVATRTRAFWSREGTLPRQEAVAYPTRSIASV
jgi:hypothetical protein